MNAKEFTLAVVAWLNNRRRVERDSGPERQFVIGGIQRGEHFYLVLWDASRKDELAAVLGRWAGDRRLNFGFDDASAILPADRLPGRDSA